MLEELHAEVRFVSKISLSWILSFWRPCQLGGPKVASVLWWSLIPRVRCSNLRSLWFALARVERLLSEAVVPEGATASTCGANLLLRLSAHASHVWLRGRQRQAHQRGCRGLGPWRSAAMCRRGLAPAWSAAVGQPQPRSCARVRKVSVR